ncbi:MAG: serine hydroxymethyltransferase [Patescibacteria group bacterium]
MRKLISLVKENNRWRESCINLIASENVMSPLAEKLYLSDFMHRYAEGLPFKRFYQGTKYIDEIEDSANNAFQKHFKANFVDLRPISGTLANLATFSALAEKGDKILTLGIEGGSHVSHEKYGAAGLLGLQVSHLDFDQRELSIDTESAKKKIFKIKPKFIVLGGSVILFPQPIKELKRACQKVGAKIVYDAAHVFGLICAGLFQQPLKEGADIITSSTHKTFPGPQGGIILGNIDEPLRRKLTYKVFPGVLSNHHLHRLPALYLTLLEMQRFGESYARQIVKNAKALARELYNFGFSVLGREKGFTQSHQLLVNVKEQGGGTKIAKDLESVNIILNKNVIPGDKLDVNNPIGLRVGVQEMTRYGMKEKEMRTIARLIKEAVLDKKDIRRVRKEVVSFRKNFREIKYCFKA